MARFAPRGIATPTVHDEKCVIELNHLAFALLAGASGASSPSKRRASVAVAPAAKQALGDARTDDRRERGRGRQAAAGDGGH